VPTQALRTEALRAISKQAGGQVRHGDAKPVSRLRKSSWDDIETLRVDTAVPEQVYLDRAFDLAVVVRQHSSAILREDELKQIRSGDIQVSWPETKPHISLRVQISAPECRIHEADSYSFRLYAGHDSPIFYFHLTPKELGEISILVRVFQKDDWLGGARVHTIVKEHIVGNVQMVILSYDMPSILGTQTGTSASKSNTEEDNHATSVDRILPTDAATLRQILVHHFSLEELRTLCADLGVSYDELPGEGQEAKARELIAYLQRRARLSKLVSCIRQYRPNVKL
jgi:hypothetical protein